MKATELRRIAENELEKLLVVGSQGRLRVRLAPPADAEPGSELVVQRRGSTDPGITIRLVATNELDQDLNGDPVIAADVPVAQDDDRLNSRRYWYVFAYFCEGHLGFAEPIYIVPAPALRRFVDHERPTSPGTTYAFRGSMIPGDELWDRFAFSLDDLAHAIVKALLRLEALDQAGDAPPATEAA